MPLLQKNNIYGAPIFKLSINLVHNLKIVDQFGAPIVNLGPQLKHFRSIWCSYGKFGALILKLSINLVSQFENCQYIWCPYVKFGA